MLLTAALVLVKCFVEAVSCHWYEQCLAKRVQDRQRASVIRLSLDDVKESLRHVYATIILMFRVGSKQLYHSVLQ